MQEPVSYLGIAGQLIGGLGLFLLAVRMITDGLRFAAGSALRDILGRWTSTPLRGIASGIALTAIVQSSSAVTVATIGFVNAGLMSMFQALGVVYGANVGTTMTGWLVAAMGFKFKVELFALPMVGLGMALRLTSARTRYGALGEALAGFGLFFIGIDVLREAFTSFAVTESMEGLSANNMLGSLLYLWVGFMMTVLTQSSSAAIALILTAATGGVLDLSSAAAMVIGANVGTTSTAGFAAIGATSNAKRVAAAHILFNLLTGVVAIILLPMLLWVVDVTGRLLNLEHVPAVTLALFHTVFNVLGVLLMMPLTRPLARFLSARFCTADEIEGTPRYLDRTIAATPALGLNAISMELDRMGGIVRRMSIAALSTEIAEGRSIDTDHSAIKNLSMAIGEFIQRVSQANVNEDVSEDISQVLRIVDYYNDVAELAVEFSATEPALQRLDNDRVLQAIAHYRAEVVRLLENSDPTVTGVDPACCDSQLAAIEEHYQSLKKLLLEEGAALRLNIAMIGERLEQLGRCRGIARRVAKAARSMSSLRQSVAPAKETSAENPADEAVQSDSGVAGDEGTAGAETVTAASRPAD